MIPRSPEGRFLLPDSYPAGQGKILHYRVLLEPLGTNVFFVAPKPRWVQGGYRMVTMDAGGALYDLDREHPVGVYEGESDVSRPREGALLSGWDGEVASNLVTDEKKLLQLPQLDPRIPQLAREITARSRIPYQQAADLENYLRTHYGYTLDLGRVVPKDPLASFLFERKQGHCEYFASAMAVMLRTLGIPARVVNGFRGGEFNDITSQYVVRMRNAHSWVEAYIPNYGWMSFDPTPGDSLGAHGRLSRIMLYLDAASSFWREWVINYDVQHQRELGQAATNSSRQFFERTRNWGQDRYQALLDSARRLRYRMIASPKSWAFGAICMVVLLLAIVNGRAALALIARAQLAAHPERSPQKAASIWYERMIRTVARRGWHKQPAQTPAEFAGSIEDGQLQRAVANFTDRYEKARFADSPEDAKALPELYQEISAARRS
jgi:transglutaminase-like putative cysteine protease